MFKLEDDLQTPFEMKRGVPICFKFIGIGDAGARIMRRMIQADIKGIDLIAVHADEQALCASGASIKIQIGVPPANGQAVCIQPEIDSNTLEVSRDAVAKALAGAEVAVIVADMGHCTGTGVAPVVAGVARELGILTIGIVTKPSGTESHSHMLQAEMGLAALLALADSLAVIPTERPEYAIHRESVPLSAFEIAEDALYQVVQTICSFSRHTEPICLDFSDMAVIMRNAGMVYVGMGRGAGEFGAAAAAKMAISTPLTEVSMCGAKRLLIHITCSERFGIEEIERASTVVKQAADPNASLVLAVTYDKVQKEGFCMTVIAAEGEGKAEDDFPNGK